MTRVKMKMPYSREYVLTTEYVSYEDLAEEFVAEVLFVLCRGKDHDTMLEDLFHVMDDYEDAAEDSAREAEDRMRRPYGPDS